MKLHDVHYDLARIAAAQHGCLTTQQLLEAVSQSGLRQLVHRGSLVRVTSGAYRVAGSPPTWEQAVMALTLAAPAGAVASHVTAWFRNAGLTFVTQKRIGRYRVDFVWTAERVVVEVDGFRSHDARRSAFDADRHRRNALIAQGWTVLHVTSNTSEAEFIDVLATTLRRNRVAYVAKTVV